jgi:hypothetical protein
VTKQQLADISDSSFYQHEDHAFTRNLHSAISLRRDGKGRALPKDGFTEKN